DGRCVIEDGLRFVASLVERTSAIEIPPGKLRPQSNTVAKISCGQDVFSQFSMTDAPLHQRPVMPGIELQGAVQLGDGPSIILRSATRGVGRRQEVMITGACGLDLACLRKRLPGVLGFSKQLQIFSPVAPQRLRGLQTNDGFSTVQQGESTADSSRISRIGAHL